MSDKKKTAPLGESGTVNTSAACNTLYDDYSTVSLDIQEDSYDLTYNGMLRAVTLDYLGGLDPDIPPSPAQVESELLLATNNAIEDYNLGERDPDVPANAKISEAYPNAKDPDLRVRKLRVLAPWQVAQVIKYLHHAKCICWMDDFDDGNYDIGIYQTDGDMEGVYDTSQCGLEQLIREYHSTITSRDVAEVVSVLRADCERVSCCDNPDLIAVKNGIFDYKNKALMPFDPEHVFVTKSGVDFVMNAPNPVIHNDDGTDWDVVSWVDDLSDDSEVTQLLWEMLGAAIRPGVSWNKSAWLYSETGNNGKGTYCTLMRNLCGKGAWTSIPLKVFGEPFMLEPLMRVSAVITDENDTSTYLDDAAALKSIITGDPFQINRKFKDPRALRFRGFMVQCVNAYPRLRDRSESMYRRLLVVPFNKRFEGRERKYIKNDYLHRKDVLEYVMFHVLYEMDYYELSVPEACVAALDEYRMVNDPVRDFCEDILQQAAWDLLPWTFLHDLYKCWMVRRQPQSRAESLRAFKSRVLSILDDYPEWSTSDSAIRTGNRMDVPEPLILEYDVTEWMNKDYKGQDRMKLCTVEPKVNYRGLVRDPSVAASLAADAASGVGVTPDGSE